MKTTFFFALALISSSAFAGTVPGTGCVWNEHAATCMVSNDSNIILACDVRVQVTTDKNQKTTKQKVSIMPKTMDTVKVLAPWGEKLEKTQIAAICKPE